MIMLLMISMKAYLQWLMPVLGLDFGMNGPLFRRGLRSSDNVGNNGLNRRNGSVMEYSIETVGGSMKVSLT